MHIEVPPAMSSNKHIYGEREREGKQNILEKRMLYLPAGMGNLVKRTLDNIAL